mmetsp:Transcript_56795/g.157215  ORF Transcript_56795/g.157215 Transcript_56795/m.157215 type:complete len:123 (-) Transcript_56795:92-460(-)
MMAVAGAGRAALGRAQCALSLPTLASEAIPCNGSGAVVWHSVTQVRWKSNLINSVSLLRQYYNRMPIRKKWRRAILRGTMIMCEKTGQVRMPPIAISGYDDKKNPYRGKFEHLRSPRIWFKD